MQAFNEMSMAAEGWRCAAGVQAELAAHLKLRCSS